MFNFFKKHQRSFNINRHKNLSISLPSHWEYEFDAEGQQSCYDPKSKSTLRINILTAIPPHQETEDQIIETLTGNQPHIITSKGYLLTNSTYFDTIDGGQNITLITWMLINHKLPQKITAVFTYTVLSSEKDSPKEKEIILIIENSLRDADLTAVF